MHVISTNLKIIGNEIKLNYIQGNHNYKSNQYISYKFYNR